MTVRLALGFDASFADLYDRDGLTRIDARFLEFLTECDDGLKTRLVDARRSRKQWASAAPSRSC